jgi:hypothetical protein
MHTLFFLQIPNSFLIFYLKRVITRMNSGTIRKITREGGLDVGELAS